MKILVTGAKGFVGRNLCAQLKNIRDGKARWYGIGSAEEAKANANADALFIEAIYEYDIDSTPEELDAWCQDCTFVFNLAGVNRPQDPKEFMEGNFGFATVLLNTLKKYHNTCPVMISSSIQATLAGRFGTSEYGKSKKAGEELMFQYSEETGAKVLVYRFPNLFGKWCRPNYNSAIATFCNNIANDMPITVNDPSVDMELLYIDDLIDELINSLKGEGSRCEFDGVETVPTADGRYYFVPVTHKTTLGEIVDIINECADAAANKDGINMIDLTQGSLRYKLMTTYLSYLPREKAIYDHKMNVDPRGSFTELLHTLTHGQVSINISKPGITKGEHWHHSKFEYFTVVSGHGLIQLRPENPDMKTSETLKPSETDNVRVREDGVIEYEVSGDKIQSVIMLPGYTHNIINLSDTQDLVTVMYCNEIFNPGRPDTYFDPVEKK
ncbi:MAG: NAD-dependent epimerase/dehydratase family protein [Prevotellaceae bacterium]|nr:NAD-dependent epimerase/dehydratase family protein [Prevotellaceae bacterium]